MPGGSYRIGGWRENEPLADLALKPFWVARFPVTVAQFAQFVKVGYNADAEHWWTPHGWQWKQEEQHMQPRYWDHPELAVANQPLIGVTWYEAVAFCNWLHEQPALPDGYAVRLPTEAEWEAAAAYDSRGERHDYPWGDEEPTPEHAIYDANSDGRPAPVGCCPAGAAACGALDMAGNVWEWTTSSYRNYPEVSSTEEKDFTAIDFAVPLRGGSWVDDGTSVRCGARFRDVPNFRDFDYGFRVVVAPRAH